MIRSKKTKEQIFRDGLKLFTNGEIPDDIFNGYMTDDDGEGASKLQEWIIDNMRGEIMDWCTGIGIIEAVEHLFKCALENGNLSEEISEIELKRESEELESIIEADKQTLKLSIDGELFMVGYNPHRLNPNDPYNKKEINFVKAINHEGKFNPNFLDDIVSKKENGVKQCLDVNEYKIALSVIQWLGTPVGQGFLEKVSKM